MNFAQIHLAINHFPLMALALALPVLIWGQAQKSPDIIRVALSIFVLAALATIPAYLTGDPAEDLLTAFDASISKDLIHEHEEAADISLIFISITGALALGLLFADRVKALAARKNLILRGVLVWAVASFIMMGVTTHRGGQIRHAEIRMSAPNSGAH